MQQGDQHRGFAPVRVVLVGHCVPDSYMLKGVIERAVQGAEVVRANDDDALASAIASADVLLINRVLDGEFADDSGLGLIRRVAGKGAGRPAVMLVSNLPDAQREAEQAGALPGIGKATCGNEESARRLRAGASAATAARAAG